MRSCTVVTEIAMQETADGFFEWCWESPPRQADDSVANPEPVALAED